MHFCFLILFLRFCLTKPVTGLENTKDTALLQLRRDLFNPTRYDKSNAPHAQNTNQHLSIYMKLYLFHVYKINEASGALSINGFFHAFWTDERLRWHPINYGDVSELLVPRDLLWIPQIILFNDAAMKNQIKYGATEMLINNNGSVYLAAPTTFISTCEIDHKYYPFDKHICTVEYGRWTLEANLRIQLMDTHHEEDILKHFSLENPEWKILYRQDRLINRTYVCCSNEHFEFYKLEFGIERQAQFFSYFLITPSIICVFITLIIFRIPIEQHGYLKITLAGLVIFVLITLLSFLSWKIPSGGKSTPLIVLFCGNSLIMASASIAATIATLKISRLSQQSIPPIVQNVTKIILGNCKKRDLQSHQLERETSFREDNSWILVVAAFDRTCFIIYVCVFIYLLYNSFKYA